MKTSLNTWTFPDNYGFEDCFIAAKKAGFEALEFTLDNPGHSEHSFTLDSTDEEILAVGALAKKYGIIIPSISTSLATGNWTKIDEEGRKAIFTITEKQLKIAKLLGADTILTVPGGMFSAALEGKRDVMLLSEARRNSLKNMRDFLPTIEKYGIKVGVENVGNLFFVSPYDMISFITDIGSDLVGAYLDLGNMFAYSDPIHWIDVLGDKIFKIHLKDYKRTSIINKGGNYVMLLEGGIDFERCMQLLKSVGFDGYLTGELTKIHPDVSDEDYFNTIVAAERVMQGYYDKA